MDLRATIARTNGHDKMLCNYPPAKSGQLTVLVLTDREMLQTLPRLYIRGGRAGDGVMPSPRTVLRIVLHLDIDAHAVWSQPAYRCLREIPSRQDALYCKTSEAQHLGRTKGAYGRDRIPRLVGQQGDILLTMAPKCGALFN